MLNIDESIVEAFRGRGREIAVRVTFDDLYTFGGDYVISYSINGNMGNNEALQLGYVPSRELKLSMYTPPTEDYPINFEKAKIKVELGIQTQTDIEYVSLGVFYCDSFTTRDEFRSIDILAYDSMLKFDKVTLKYSTNLDVEQRTPSNLINELCLGAGVSCVLPEYTTTTQLLNSEKGLWIDGIWHKDGNNYVTRGNLQNTYKLAHIDKDFTFQLQLPDGVDYSDYTIDIHMATEANELNKRGGIEIIPVSNYSYVNLVTTDGLNWYFEDAENLTFTSSDGSISVEELSNVYFIMNLMLGDDCPEDYVPELYVDCLDVKYTNLDRYIDIDFNEKFSYRTMLGYLAAYIGCYAMINREDVLEFKSFTNASSVVIEDSVVQENGISKTSEENYTANLFITGTSDIVVTLGNGEYGYNFENPLFTYVNIDAVRESYYSLGNDKVVTSTGSLNYFYDPRVELGDIVIYKNSNGDTLPFLVLTESISVAGGVSSTISCNLNKETSNSFYTTSLSNYIKEKKPNNDSVVISGTTGGFVKEVYDEDGVHRATAITSIDTDLIWVNSSTGGKVISTDLTSVPMWVYQEGGMYYSTDNGNTYTIAIDKNGMIEPGEIKIGDTKIYPAGGVGSNKAKIMVGSYGIDIYGRGSGMHASSYLGAIDQYGFKIHDSISISKSNKIICTSYDLQNGMYMYGPFTFWNNTVHFRCDNKIGDIGYESSLTVIGDVYSSGGYHDLSDSKQKTDVVDIDDTYESFIMDLEPVSFKYTDSNSNRKHLGFLAQSVRDAAQDTIGDVAIYSAFSTDDKGDIVPYSEDTPEEELNWFLRYEELIAPTISVLQKYVKKVNDLESRIEYLEDKLKEITKE